MPLDARQVIFIEGIVAHRHNRPECHFAFLDACDCSSVDKNGLPADGCDGKYHQQGRHDLGRMLHPEFRPYYIEAEIFTELAKGPCKTTRVKTPPRRGLTVWVDLCETHDSWAPC